MRTPSPAMVVACLALFVGLGGTGYAASSGALSSDGQTVTAAAKKKSSSNRGPRGFRGFKGATGPQGPAGPQGAAGAQGPQGAAGAQGPAGPAGSAKAFASISNTGAVDPAHSLNITSANVSTPAVGRYCINVAGIGITTGNAMAVVSLNYDDDETNAGDTVNVNTGTNFNTCPAGQIQVRTYDSGGLLALAGFNIVFL